MNKYLLSFYKQGNMRFISHLDLQRLFFRAIRKAELPVAYSNGYNPHQKVNIVQPLSLGFEAENELFEITLTEHFSPKELAEALNRSMPEGIRFFRCKEISPEIVNLSKYSEYALYEASVKGNKADFERLNTKEFLSQPRIMVFKRDKKTKEMVEKDVKDMVGSLEKAEWKDERYVLRLMVKCASNTSLNPANLLEALHQFYNIPYNGDDTIVNRKNLLSTKDNQFIDLYDLPEQI